MIREDAHRLGFAMRAALAALSALSLGACATTGGQGATDVVSEIPSAQSSLDAGDEAARRGDLQRALAYYVRAASMEDSVDGWIRVGAASERLGDTERALHAYLQVIRLDPLHVDALQGAGLAYLALGDPGNAGPHLARVVEQDAQRWRAHNALGIVADQAGDHASAIGHFTAALGLNPSAPMLLNNLGYSRYLAGELDQAARDFYQATQQHPDYEPAWSNLGMVYAHRGWYRDAVGIFGRVVDEATAHNDAGFIAFQRGDLAEAEELLREAVRRSPTYYPAANRNLERVRARLRDERNGTDERTDSAGGPLAELSDRGAVAPLGAPRLVAPPGGR